MLILKCKKCKVVLDFPFKDCVLEGGQSSEEGLDHYFEYEEEKQKTVDGKKIIEVNPEFYRPTEVETLFGDCSKIKNTIGWTPHYTFDNLVLDMFENQMKKYKNNTYKNWTIVDS